MADPLAYLITVSAYGNRLHGDERGSVDRAHNAVGTPFRQPEPGLEAWERQRMRAKPMLFDAARRACVEASFVQTCVHRGWKLHAAQCRTNHAHVVVTSDVPIERTAHDLKAFATRELRRARFTRPDEPVWARSASMRILTSERAVAAAVNYTLNAQGADIDGTYAKRTRHLWED